MTYRTLLLVLYGAGLRISEAIGLTLADVDLAERVLTVRNTKFYKTRLVPIGPQLAAALVAYYEQRSKLPTPKTKDSAFLCSRAGGRLTYPQVVTLFQRIRSAAGIACPPGESRLPRLHDLRHTAAAHRVLAWYRAGLRISEAIGLTVADVDLAERVLTVRNTKFYKTRLVPIGPQLAAALVAYYEQRSKLPTPKTKDSAFLCSRTGGRLTYPQVVTLFQRIRSDAGIVCPPGESRPPRLHDLRHTAAAHRVLAWYRAGLNVQQLLPRLATYLGHASIASTQRYLQMTPELLQQASRRFAAYALQDAEQGVDHA